MSNILTHGSLFSGVGGFDLGFDAAGIETKWQCEIDPKPRSVLARHWPNATQYTDVCAVKGSEVDPVDVISFGSPCQDLSVAGKRAGFEEGTRSSLYFEAIRIIKEMRDGTAGAFPRFAIWENVRGALSSNGGRDFLAAVEALADIGAVDIAWRVVNTCHFGPPQRRVRVFVVADFGGECAGPVLAEPTRVLWHPGSGGTEGTEPASEVEGRSGSSGWTAGFSAGNSAGAGSIGYQDEMSPTIRAGASGTNQTPTIITNCWTAARDTTAAVTIHIGTGVDEDFASGGHLVYAKGKRASSTTDDETWHDDRPAPTLTIFDNATETRATVVAVDTAYPYDEYNDTIGESVHHALRAGTKQSTGVLTTSPTYRVRRLTPRECERLQGWPDDHTRYDSAGNELSDSARYKMAGNGISAPVSQWLGENIKKATLEENND